MRSNRHRMGLQRDSLHRTSLNWAPLIVVLSLTWATGCGAPPEPPLPEDLSQLDPSVQKMYQDAYDAVSANPDEGEEWYAMGMGYQANELFEYARISYRRAVELQPDHPQAWYQLGRVLKREGAVEQAIEAIGTAGELSNYAPAYWRKGEWLMELGKVEQAKVAFLRATELDPDDVAGWVGQARVAVEQGDAAGAVPILEKVLMDRPDEPEAHLLLGTAYRQLDRAQDAKFHLAYGQGEPIIRSDDWASELVLYRVSFNDKLQLANQYLAANQLDIATTMLQHLRDEKPDHLRTLTTLARAYRLGDRAGDARGVIEQGLELHPDDYGLLSELVPVLHQLGDVEGAMGMADRCIELQPDKALSYARKGAVLLDENRPQDALREYQRAVELDGSDAEILRSLGDCQSKLENWSIAESMYARAIALETKDPDLYVRLGYAAFQNKNWDAAGDALSMALRLGPTRPDNVTALLRRVREAQGQAPGLGELTGGKR